MMKRKDEQTRLGFSNRSEKGSTPFRKLIVSLRCSVYSYTSSQLTRGNVCFSDSAEVFSLSLMKTVFSMVHLRATSVRSAAVTSSHPSTPKTSSFEQCSAIFMRAASLTLGQNDRSMSSSLPHLLARVPTALLVIAAMSLRLMCVRPGSLSANTTAHNGQHGTRYREQKQLKSGGI
jgi:hypothetical protein